MTVQGSFKVKGRRLAVGALFRVAWVLALMVVAPVVAHGAASCAVGNPCNLPWGGQISDGQNVTAYQAGSVACGSNCAGETRNCSNGTLSGSYTYQTCTSAACGCSLPWGGTIDNGQSTTAYQYSSVPYGSTCTSQSRSCSNGSLSGTYQYQSCSVQAPAGCSLPWGGSIAHGQSVTAYAASSVAYGSSCSSQSRTCNNGSLSGTYQYQSCSVQAPASCGLPWGGTIAHGASVTAYASATVPYGSSCSGQTRTCNNGTLSGSYTNKTCSVNPPASCSATTAAWDTSCSGAVAAKSSGGSETVTNTAGCYSGTITASCSNGSWSYSSGTCSYTCGGGGGGGGGCFLAGTYVLMADGTSKPIEELKVGDLVASAHGTNRVTGLNIHDSREPVYALNGGKPFITGEHVIFTTTGTRVIDPKRLEAESEYYDHKSIYNSEMKQGEKPGKLKVGDIIIMDGGQYLPVTSITSVERQTYKLYNPSLDGDHTYYANGILVHNLIKQK